MFHQVFICDTPVEGNGATEQANEINLSFGFDDSKETTSNVKTKCDDMELDVLPNPDLGKPQKLEPPVEQLPDENETNLDQLWSSRLSLSDETTSNIKTKCDDMELDVLPKSDLGKPQTLEPPVEQLPDENETNLDQLWSLRLPLSDETTSNVKTKCDDMELDVLPRPDLGKPQKLEPQVEQLPEESNTNLDQLWSSELPLSDECIIAKDDSNIPITPKKGVGRWISSLNKEQMQEELRKLGLDTPRTRDMCRTVLRNYFKSKFSNKKEQNSSITEDSSNVPITPKQCISNWIISLNKEQIQKELRKLGLDTPRTIDMCRTVLRDYFKSKSLNKKEQNVITNIQTVIRPNEMNLDPTSDIAGITQTPKLDIKLDPIAEENEEYYDILQSSEVNQDNEASAYLKNEIIQSSSLLNVTRGSHLPPEERESFSDEEDSGSDWEQEYFGLNKADLKRKHLKYPCKQSINSKSNLTCLNSISHKKKSGNETMSMKLYPIKLFRIVVHRLEDSFKLQENKCIRNLKEEKEIDKGEVRTTDGYKCEKTNKNSDNLNNTFNKDESFCNVFNLTTKQVSHINYCHVKNQFKTGNNLTQLNDNGTFETPFSISGKINNHKKKNLTTEHKCIDCNKHYSKKYRLENHIREKHPATVLIPEREKKAKKEKEIELEAQNEETFVCMKCLKPLKTKHQLNNHKKTLCYGFRKTRNHQCDMCGKLFDSKVKLQNHKNSHNNAKPYKCKSCDNYFNSITARCMHFKKVHQQIYFPKFLCSFCGITHTSLLHMLAHEETHRLPDGAEIPTPFRCNECGRGYISRFKLAQHIRRHRQVKCPQCSEKFKNKYQLMYHLRDAHNIVKDNKCNICKQNFISSTALNSHAAVHSSVLRFSCEVCGKGFKTKHLIEQHLITHSDERPLSCPECGDRFKRKTHLNQHISAIHGKGRRQ